MSRPHGSMPQCVPRRPAPAAPSASAQAARLAQLVQDRVRDGQLLEPSQDSAVAHLTALRTADPSGNAAASSTRTVANALLDAGRTALAARDFDKAQAYATAAGPLGLNMPDVDALQRAISAERATPAARPVPQRTRYVAPVYPQDALKKGISGDVRLRITVAANGKIKSATVVNSNPAKVFDEAALDAVRRWRFKSFAQDDPDVEAIVMTNILFRPDEVKKP